MVAFDFAQGLGADIAKAEIREKTRCGVSQFSHRRQLIAGDVFRPN